MRYSVEVAHGMYVQLGEIIKLGLKGFSFDQANKLVQYLSNLAGDLGLPKCLTDVGIAEYDIDQLADDAVLQTRLLANSPRENSLKDAIHICSEAL